MPSERTIASITPADPGKASTCGCSCWMDLWDLCLYHEGFDDAAEQADELQAEIDRLRADNEHLQARNERLIASLTAWEAVWGVDEADAARMRALADLGEASLMWHRATTYSSMRRGRKEWERLAAALDAAEADHD